MVGATTLPVLIRFGGMDTDPDDDRCRGRGGSPRRKQFLAELFNSYTTWLGRDIRLRNNLKPLADGVEAVGGAGERGVTAGVCPL